MGLDALLTGMECQTVTSVTAVKKSDVTPKPSPVKACTPVTSVTSQNIDAQSDERIGKMTAKLENDPALLYAMETHDEIEPDAVILTLAIRGKGACELRIPKSRYDAFALLKLIEKHTTLETLQ